MDTMPTANDSFVARGHERRASEWDGARSNRRNRAEEARNTKARAGRRIANTSALGKCPKCLLAGYNPTTEAESYGNRR